jgi:acetylornithine deacetylase/succinyl-diaminopimelate desuccinylase-like protein
LAMAALAAADLPLETGVKAGCTEAGIYASKGIVPVVFGPGPSTGVIHAPNEYNLVSEVEGALRFYRELLRL